MFVPKAFFIVRILNCVKVLTELHMTPPDLQHEGTVR